MAEYCTVTLVVQMRRLRATNVPLLSYREKNSAARSRYTQRDHMSSKFTNKRDIMVTQGVGGPL